MSTLANGSSSDRSRCRSPQTPGARFPTRRTEHRSFAEQVELPQVAPARAQHGVQREEPGAADAFLEKPELGEFLTRRLVERHVEAVLAREQHAFRAQRELRVQPQIAQQV